MAEVVILLAVSILPNPLSILPATKVPTVLIFACPVVGTNVLSASVLVYLLSNWVCTLLVRPFIYPNSVEVVLILNNLLRSDAVEFKDTLLILRLVTSSKPSIVTEILINL